MSSLLSVSQKSMIRASLKDVFDTFARPFTVYVEAQQLTISTDPSYSRFGQHDQNVDHPAVLPQSYTLTGCILYGSKQPFDYMASFGTDTSKQNKVRVAEGKVRVKVDATGYALFKDAKRIVIDGINFDNDSTPRPHGIVGAPDRYSFDLTRVE